MTKTGILRATNRYLNLTDDPLIGQSVTGGQAYTGQLGDFVELNAADAAKLSDPNGKTLYAGIYQYVQFKSGSSASNVVGGPVFWDDPDNFVVTPDVPATFLGFAGVS